MGIGEGGNSEGFIYNLDGQRVSVWDLSNGIQMRGETCWNGMPIEFNYFTRSTYPLQDWLGTKREVVNAGGTPAEACISLPFGDGLTCAGPDLSGLHFTGKERDQESGNDYFGARYYNSNFGRFLSPDPGWSMASSVSNPQSWNQYAYVMGNPLRWIDPTGMGCNDDKTNLVSDNVVRNGGGGVVETMTVTADCNPPQIPLSTQTPEVQARSQPSSFHLPVNAPAANNGNVFTCAAGFADTYSIAGGLRALGIGNSGVGGFITNALGGNAFSGFTNLVSSFGSGSAGGHNVFYNMGESVVAGPLQGIPGGSGPWGASASDLATGAIAGGAFSTVTGAGQTLQGLNGAASLASTGIDAAEFAAGVGEVKFAADAAIYFGGLAKCAAQ